MRHQSGEMSALSSERSIWCPVLTRNGKPAYLEIVDAIARDVALGKLQPQDALPPQRVLAQMLGLNFSTVSRAYAQAQRRGLIVSKVGQGTVIAAPTMAAKTAAVAADFTMNLPPEPDQPPLLARMQDGMRRLTEHTHLADLLRYQDFGGSEADRQAGAQWLSRRLPAVSAQNVLVSPGAQSALMAILSGLARPGDSLCCDALTFTGLKTLAAHLGLKLIGLPSDGDGMDADALAAACRDHAPKALYLNPTLHNPTTVTLSDPKRRALAAVARQFHLPIIEDDAYGALPLNPPPPLAALAPELTYHIAGLAKCLGAGLRIAYVLAPEGQRQAKLSQALRATSGMASPVTAALARLWIADGTADAVLDFIRAETEARRRLAAEILPAGLFHSQPHAFHLWLKLPPPWTRLDFLTHLRNLNLGVVTGDAFAVTHPAPEAVRLCIGGPIDRPHLRQALILLDQTLAQDPTQHSGVI